MFVAPDIAITEVLAWIRELAVITGIVLFGWNARKVYQFFVDAYDGAKCFMGDVRLHMKIMEGFALRVEHNHLSHIEKTMDKLVGNKPELTDASNE